MGSRTSSVRLQLFLSASLLIAAKPQGGPVHRIDRMWLVGAPALDGRPRPGIYAWVSSGRLEFAVVPVGDGRRSVYQWTIKSTRPLRLAEQGNCKVAARREKGLVLAARPVYRRARCAVSSEGELTLSRFRVGRRGAHGFLGPLARPAAARVRIGRY